MSLKLSAYVNRYGLPIKQNILVQLLRSASTSQSPQIINKAVVEERHNLACNIIVRKQANGVQDIAQQPVKQQ